LNEYVEREDTKTCFGPDHDMHDSVRIHKERLLKTMSKSLICHKLSSHFQVPN